MRGVKKHRLDSLDIMDLLCFIAVAEEGSSHGAARRLNVTQPLVSYRIQLIENFFRRSVYFRNTKGNNLTPFGQIAYEYARQVVDAHKKLINLAKEYQDVDIYEGRVPVNRCVQTGSNEAAGQGSEDGGSAAVPGLQPD